MKGGLLKGIFEKEDLMQRFLLGTVSEQEQVEIEDRFVADDDFFERLLALEDELIDAYERGALTTRERALFESRFLTRPSGRERLEFARTLRSSIARIPSDLSAMQAEASPFSWWQNLLAALRAPRRPVAWAATLVLIVMLGGILWVLLDRSKSPSPAELAQSQPAPRDSTQTVRPPENVGAANEPEVIPLPAPSPSAPQEKKSRQATSTVVASFVLTPGLLRDSGASKTLVIPQNAAQVSFQLPLEQGTVTDYKNYRASITLADGKKIWSGSVRKSPGGTLQLALPATLFEPGDYILELRGITSARTSEAVAEYAFRIGRR
jgi:hypothetical protein